VRAAEIKVTRAEVIIKNNPQSRCARSWNIYALKEPQSSACRTLERRRRAQLYPGATGDGAEELSQRSGWTTDIERLSGSPVQTRAGEKPPHHIIHEAHVVDLLSGAYESKSAISNLPKQGNILTVSGSIDAC
jgi:hypothetical protein